MTTLSNVRKLEKGLTQVKDHTLTSKSEWEVVAGNGPSMSA